MPAGRVRYLQPTEARSLLMACPQWLRPIVGLAVSTGMRRSEILKLRWLDIDFAHAHILLPQPKNGEERIVYLNRSALVVLDSIMRAPETKPTSLIFAEITPDGYQHLSPILRSDAVARLNCVLGFQHDLP